MEEDKLLEERKEKIIAFFKQDKYLATFASISALALLFSIIALASGIFIFASSVWFVLFICAGISAVLCYFKQHKYAFYPILIWVIYLAVFIRTLNLSGLRDITTGQWTLGPDLDPFLFLRWAKDIVAHGSIMVNDVMRYVPLGYDTKGEMMFLSYLIAWFHKIALWFGSTSVEQSAAIFPAFAFAATLIPFFLFARKIFLNSLGNAKSSIIALIASLFFSVIPVFIPRTVAGIPEKESAAFFFMFFAFYFFLSAWQTDKHWKRIVLALLAGISTAGLGLIWGGVFYVLITISIAVFIVFLFGQINMAKSYAYIIYFISFLIFIQLFSTRYSISGMITAPVYVSSFVVLLLLIVHLVLNNAKLKRYAEINLLKKFPSPIISLIVTALIGLLFVMIFLGPSSIIGSIKEASSHLIVSVQDRFGVTVAENRQPFFDEWANSFGPHPFGIPLTFWLFFIGSIYLFYKLLHVLDKKTRIILTSSYILFLVCLIFSRYKGDSILNGTSGISMFIYALGYIILFCSSVHCYYKYYKSGELDKFKEISFNLILLFIFFFFGVISARGSVRTIMMLAPPISIIIAFFAVDLISNAKISKNESRKYFAWALAILVAFSAVYAGYQFYNESSATASAYIPTGNNPQGWYHQQWQKAMSWVRESTPQNAVFAHWWDYGYWIQSIGNRATVLDGGNAIVYWDHLMGRHVLTGTNDSTALEFLYTHNTTHLLVDSTDIGKYPAFASIGSDDNYDHYSWINPFLRDNRQTHEAKNSTFYVYTGGTALDNDLIYNDNGTEIFLPGGKAAIAGVIVEKNKSGEILSAPIGVFVYNNKQYRLPLRYAYDNTKLNDFKEGIDAGIYLFDWVNQDKLEKDGAMLYLSSRTIHTILVRLFLFKENNPYFKLVHSEDDFYVSYLKSINLTTDDFVYANGVRGPIKIWEVNYPKNIKSNPEFLLTSYPNINYTKVR